MTSMELIQAGHERESEQSLVRIGKQYDKERQGAHTLPRAGVMRNLWKHCIW